MITTTVTQQNWDGQGACRSFIYQDEPRTYADRIATIRRAFNMNHTDVSVRCQHTREEWSVDAFGCYQCGVGNLDSSD